MKTEIFAIRCTKRVRNLGYTPYDTIYRTIIITIIIIIIGPMHNV